MNAVKATKVPQRTILLSVLLSLSLVLLSGCGMQGRSEAVFDSGLLLSVSYEGGGGGAAFKQMRREAERLELLINRNNPDTVVYAFNHAAAGASFTLDAELYGILLDVERLHRQTSGMFDIGIGGIGALFMTDIEGLHAGTVEALPGADAVDAVRGVTGLGGGHYTLTQSETGGTLTKKTDGFTLDLNGYIKGYAAQRMADMANARGAKNCIVNLGGDIATIEGDRAFRIGIVHPGDAASYVCVFEKPSGISLATSGTYERFYRYEYPDASVEISHISDGRSGLPAGVGYDAAARRYYNIDSRNVSATVLGANAAACDAYATALCVSGDGEVVPLMQTLLELGYESVVFTADGRMYTAGAFEFDTTYTGYTAYERVEA